MEIPFRPTLTISLITLAAMTLLARPVTSTPRNVTPTPTVLEVMRSEGLLRPPDKLSGTKDQHPTKPGHTTATPSGRTILGSAVGDSVG